MSKFATEKLETFNLIDPRLNCLAGQQDKLKWGIPLGGGYTSTVAQKANSYSNSGVSFNFNTQGQNVMIDRRFYCKIQFQVSVSGIPKVGAYLITPDASAPSSFPLSKVCESVSVNINGTTVSQNYADSMCALLRYNTDSNLLQYDLSGTPTMQDHFANYSDAMDSNRNSLNTYQASGHEQGRGGWMLDSLTGNTVGDGVTTQTAVLKFTVVEPLMVSPLQYSSADLDSALIGVNNLGVNINFAGNLDRVWSHYISAQLASGVATTTTTVASGTTAIPELLMTYINLNQIDDIKIPKQVLYPYSRVEATGNATSVSLANGLSQTFTSNAQQLSTVPKKIYIWASANRGTLTSQDCDTYLTINSLSLQYLNVAGQFSSMSQNSLFNICVKNGLQMSFTEWSGRTQNGSPAYSSVGLTGSVMCIDASDLALPSNISSGSLVNSQLQFQLGLSNYTGFI
jgi:hypothetical protein